MSGFFIKHPTIAIVISILMLMLGGLSLMGLPIEQYPNIVPPTIKMQATYSGANAETVASSVATPLEQAISGVIGADYMSSTNANNGICSLSIVFEVGTDPNMDQTLAYMRYGQATAQLPAEVSQMGITISQSTGSPLAVVTLFSPDKSLNALYLSNYGYVSLVEPIKRVPGVGEVTVFGAGKYAMRIWLDTTKMAAQNVSVAEVQDAVKKQNTVIPAGQLGAEPAPPGTEFNYTIQTKGRLTTPEQFGNIIIRADGNKILYLRDIASVELGAQTYSISSKFNGMDCGAIAIYSAPGSNAINTMDALKELMEERKAGFPPGMEYDIMLDTTLAVRASIEEIIHTLIEALVLVVIVVFVFLQGWRATLIPAIAVPVSIVATFAVFPLLGFTLNTICLMGMVLAIGLVVDDAIVVVEAVEAHMERGLTPRQAAFAAMEEVSGPVVAIALVLAAVFLPSLLLPGITGTLFQQFAVTIAISMLISAFNALTLSPALSAILLKPKNHEKGGPLKFFYKIFNKGYDATAGGFTKVCGFLTRKLIISLPLLALITYAIMPVAKNIPSGFLPDEDQGYLFGALIMQNPNSSLQLTVPASDKASELIRQNPNVQAVTAISGFSLTTGVQSTSSGFFFISLKPWSERQGEGQSAKEVAAQLNAVLSTKVSEGTAMCFMPPAIAGIGTANGITFVLEDRDGKGAQYLSEQTDVFVKEAAKRPEFDAKNGGAVRSVMSFSVAQKSVTLDEEKCAVQGVNISQANTLLQAYMGSLFINYITLYGQQWQVYMQAQGADRTSMDALRNFYVSGKNGTKVPLSTLVKIKDTTGPEFLLRQNLYNAAKLMVTPAKGYSNSEGMAALEEVFKGCMPMDMGYSFTDMSYQEEKVQNGITISQIFALSSVFVFLILAALYERWTLPLSIFMTVPIAALGAFCALEFFDYELNLYAQIGLIMLIGLAAKNAILIVEFAVIEMERGKSLMDATLSAARIRLRPILMTSFAFILGCVPLALASGSGAYSRNIIGIVVIAGMSMATIVGTFLIPCCFYFIMKLFRVKISHKTLSDKQDPDEVIAHKHLMNELEAATEVNEKA